jgi:CheY-like chemotaxis protein
VEDNLINQKVLTNLLAKLGHTFDLAGTGAHALSKVEESEFDLILMDVHMPEMDGLEATTRIRASEVSSGGHMPIIGVTASASKGDLRTCLNCGMDACITKPIDVQELNYALARVARGELSGGGMDLGPDGYGPDENGGPSTSPAPAPALDLCAPALPDRR